MLKNSYHELMLETKGKGCYQIYIARDPISMNQIVFGLRLPIFMCIGYINKKYYKKIPSDWVTFDKSYLIMSERYKNFKLNSL